MTTNRASVVLFVLATPLLVMGLMATSISGSIFHFSAFHDYIQNSIATIHNSSFDLSALDDSILSATGGAVDFSDVTGIIFVITSFVSLALAIIYRDR